ncbi:MAG: transglutaminase domain-containing protein [Desulfatibacillum sp.]|nr:transglutaminase domain-containing protein [Desulfatibacillum sp.]
MENNNALLRKDVKAQSHAKSDYDRPVPARGKEALSMDEKYLNPTPILDSDHSVVQEYVQETLQGETDPVKQAVLLFNKVRDHIGYNPYVPFHRPSDYQSSKLIERGNGYCVCKASLLCALGRAAGIPSRMGFVNIRNQAAPPVVIEILGGDLFVFHGFTEFFLDDKWVKATPAFDAPVCRSHNIDLPQFDGIHDCTLPPKDRAGKPYVDYLERFGSFHDVPLDDLLRVWEQYYGRERLDMWIEVLEHLENEENKKSKNP